MLNILTPVLTNAGTKGVMKTVFFGFMCLVLVSCAQPERQSKKLQSRDTTTPANRQQTGGNTGGAGNTAGQPGGPNTVNGSSGYTAIGDAHESLKKYENSIFKIETSGDTKMIRTGFLISDDKKVISTSYNLVLVQVIHQLGGIEEAKKLSREALITRIGELELGLSIKESDGTEILSANKAKVVGDQRIRKLAEKILATNPAISPVEDYIRIQLQDALTDVENIKVQNQNSPPSYCVTATAAAPVATTGSGQTTSERAIALRASTQVGATQPAGPAANAPANANLRIVAILGIPSAETRENGSSNGTDIFLSRGPLVNLQAALTAAGTTLTRTGVQECQVIAVAGDSNEQSIGSPMFDQNGAFIGQLVLSSGTGQNKRSFGLAAEVGL